MAKKRFGQNFLKNNAVIERIVRAIRPKPDDFMLEIGPGLGAMTQALLPHLKQLIAIEIDTDLIPELKNNCGHTDKLVIHNADALAFDLATLITDSNSDAANTNKIRAVGNLPYNISSPLLFHLMHYINHLQDGHFMLQKEVVDRIVAQPGTKDYGRLSVMLQYFCQAERLFIVSPSAFTPKPKVDSAILRLVPREKRELSTEQEKVLEKIVKQAFSQRRKTLRNNLKGLIQSEQWDKTTVDPARRAETLTVSEFIGLVQIYNLEGER